MSEGEAEGEEKEPLPQLAGAARRKSQYVYNVFKQMSQLKGKRVSDAMVEAMQLWSEVEAFQGIDSGTLVKAMYLVFKMQEEVTKNLASLVTLMSSSFMQAINEQIRAASQAQTAVMAMEQAAAQQPQAQGQAQGQGQGNPLMRILMPFLLQAMLRALSPQLSQNPELANMVNMMAQAMMSGAVTGTAGLPAPQQAQPQQERQPRVEA